MDSERACYLNVCHYTDRQIEKYFEHIKQTGLYDNSLIVIAADHPVHNTDFGGVSKDIPLYIANLPIKNRNRMWQGECNQDKFGSIGCLVQKTVRDFRTVSVNVGKADRIVGDITEKKIYVTLSDGRC